MDTCICPYLPDTSEKDTKKESPCSLLSSEVIQIEEDEIRDSETIDESTTDSISPEWSENRTTEDTATTSKMSGEMHPTPHVTSSEIKTDVEVTTSTDAATTSDLSEKESATKNLVSKTEDWLMRRKLEHANAEIECLQEALTSQWTLRNQLSSKIEEFKKKNEKLSQEMQKEFHEHVNQRNLLIHQIADVRQRLLYQTKSLSLTRSTNVELIYEKKGTAKCLTKSISGEDSLTLSSSENDNMSVTSTEVTNSETDVDTNRETEKETEDETNEETDQDTDQESEDMMPTTSKMALEKALKKATKKASKNASKNSSKKASKTATKTATKTSMLTATEISTETSTVTSTENSTDTSTETSTETRSERSTNTSTSTTDYNDSWESSSSSSAYLYSNIMEWQKRIWSPKISGQTTDIMSQSIEPHTSVSSRQSHTSQSDASIESIKVTPDDIRIDLSFLEKDIPNHFQNDSGFSEANNLASKNSAGDLSTPGFIKTEVVID